MRGYHTTIQIAIVFALLVVLDALVGIGGANATAEQVSVGKIILALSLQVASVALLFFFVRRPRRSDQTAGPWEQFRTWVTPYFLFVFAIAFALSLLYNAVACGEQSFVHSRRGEPICKP